MMNVCNIHATALYSTSVAFGQRYFCCKTTYAYQLWNMCSFHFISIQSNPKFFVSEIFPSDLPCSFFCLLHFQRKISRLNEIQQFAIIDNPESCEWPNSRMGEIWLAFMAGLAIRVCWFYWGSHEYNGQPMNISSYESIK